mmetsp:Transcript_39241/g.77161  ORF Transcript_39241/g.77161 Transcript_39241/m.77161 type:complete len:256 (+) Transcript_39241:958-1725(+)
MGFLSLRSRAIRGGYLRNVSCTHAYNNVIFCSASKVSSPSVSASTSFCSASRRGIRALFLMISRPHHVAVMVLVCCPANNVASSNPQMSSSVTTCLLEYFLDSKKLIMSSSGSSSSPVAAALALFLSITDLNSVTISFRALSLAMCKGTGALGNATVKCVIPSLRVWYRSANLLFRFSRISLPMREREAVLMISSLIVWCRSTTFGSGLERSLTQPAKKSCVSATIFSPWRRMGSPASPYLRNRSCSAIRLGSAS